MRWLHGITNSVDMTLSKLWEIVKGRLVCFSLWGCEELDMTWCLKNNNKKVVLFLVFLRTSHSVLRSGCINLHSHQEPALSHKELSSVLCDDLDEWDGRDGREVRWDRIYVYI